MSQAQHNETIKGLLTQKEAEINSHGRQQDAWMPGRLDAWTLAQLKAGTDTAHEWKEPESQVHAGTVLLSGSSCRYG